MERLEVCMDCFASAGVFCYQEKRGSRLLVDSLDDYKHFEMQHEIKYCPRKRLVDLKTKTPVDR